MKYRYIGPCRCGFGPRAFYIDEEGKIIHASQIITNAPLEKTESKEQKIESKVETTSTALERVVGTGVGPCGNGIPRGGGRGFCGGWRKRYIW